MTERERSAFSIPILVGCCGGKGQLDIFRVQV
jgi:hypothetical protein